MINYKFTTHGRFISIFFLQFEVDADDYIISVQVNKIFGHESDVITSITFYIFKGKVSPPYGLETEKKLALKEKKLALKVNFLGSMDAPERFCMLLVRYFVTTTTPLTSAKKLPAVGGDGGIAWMMVLTMALERCLLDKHKMVYQSSS